MNRKRASLHPMVFVWLAFAPGACKQREPDQAPASPVGAAPTAVDVGPDAGWIFTYAADDGRFETATEPDKVPTGSRSIVRAVNPGVDLGKRADTNAVFVLDLRELVNKGAAQARPMPRAIFETRALAGLAPGESSPLAGPHPTQGDAGATVARSEAAGKGAPDNGKADVILYGTGWCGACQSARRYFIEKAIPFVDKDIERDTTAADELRAKAQRFGIAADRIPVIDVKGRLLIGFDPARIERILGDTAI